MYQPVNGRQFGFIAHKLWSDHIVNTPSSFSCFSVSEELSLSFIEVPKGLNFAIPTGLQEQKCYLVAQLWGSSQNGA